MRCEKGIKNKTFDKIYKRALELVYEISCSLLFNANSEERINFLVFTKIVLKVFKVQYIELRMLSLSN